MMPRLLVTLAFIALSATVGNSQGFVKASGREDADIYASGTLVGANNASSVYAFDVKFAYRYFTKTLATRWDVRTRPLLEYVTNKGTRSSPDKINIGGELGLVRRFERNATAKGLAKAKPVNIQLVFNPRGEFDRKATTRSFVSRNFSHRMKIGSGFWPAKLDFVWVGIIGWIEFEFGSRFRDQTPSRDFTNAAKIRSQT